jgi:hypothetical protein
MELVLEHRALTHDSGSASDRTSDVRDRQRLTRMPRFDAGRCGLIVCVRARCWASSRSHFATFVHSFRSVVVGQRHHTAIIALCSSKHDAACLFGD